MAEQHEQANVCETTSLMPGTVSIIPGAEIVVYSESESEQDASKPRNSKRLKKLDKAPQQAPVESAEVPGAAIPDAEVPEVPDDYEEGLCREAVAEGLDPFLESIPEANREVVVARLFEDFRSATTEAKFIDNSRWRNYGAYADRGYYIIAVHATIMALYRQCPKSFGSLPDHAQELCLGLLLQLVRLAPLVANPEADDGTESAESVLRRLPGAAEKFAKSQRPPFLVRLLRERADSIDDCYSIEPGWKASWTVELGKILGGSETVKWLRGVEAARGVDLMFAKATQATEAGKPVGGARVQKDAARAEVGSKRARDGSKHVPQAPTKMQRGAVVGDEKEKRGQVDQAKAKENPEAERGKLEGEKANVRAQFEELERAKRGFEAERGKFEGEKDDLRARIEELERDKEGFEAERGKFEGEKADLRAQLEELERAKDDFEAERGKLEELERARVADLQRNHGGDVEKGEHQQELKKALKAQEKVLKKEWKAEKQDLESQVREYAKESEILKTELRKYRSAGQ